MTKFRHQKGFTLVELAIVMTIIGLLIGGILKGQELMENARVTATIAQVKSYEAATTTFRDTFSAMPGDMANASARLPNCPAATCQAPAAATTGNSIVGPAGGLDSNSTAVSNVHPQVEQSETILYWTHMLQADLIAGITDEYAQGGNTVAWGESHPAAKIGGGFLIGHGDGSTAGAFWGGGTEPSGLYLVLTNGPADVINVTGLIAGSQALSPLRAAQIDRKMDDGQPANGFIRGFGINSAGGPQGCFDNTAAPVTYIETQTQKDCGLVFRIQG